MMLLPDGTVMVQDNGTSFHGSPHWYKLTPDSSGSYVNGTWTQLADMPSGYGPLDYASAVLPDGRVIVEGGEYNGGGGVWTSLGAIYDPTTNSWASVAPPAGWTNQPSGCHGPTIGDSQSEVLPNGTFMLADICSGNVATLNASTLTWTTPAGTGKADNNDEEGWSLLPSGKMLTVDVNNGTNSEVYDPSTQTWTSAGSTVEPLAGYGSEIGPQVQSPAGWLFATGASGHTAKYNGTSWSAGPDFPNNSVQTSSQDDAADAPAAVLPDGNVLVAASPYVGNDIWNGGTDFFEFNGSTLTRVNPAVQEPNPSWLQTMLVLPTGQVMVSDGYEISVFTDAGAPISNAVPTITSVPSRLLSGGTYTLSGTTLNGLSEGSAYGDDAQNATNWPLVRITNNSSGHVFYARTLMSTRSVAAGVSGSASFTVPTGTEPGPSRLVVVANGIASNPQQVDIAGSLYPGAGISNPIGVTAGPDGALWFTNFGNNSIGRINTTGTVTNYTGTGIDKPGYITAGPDGALWFTNTGNNSIGRITTTGTVTNYTAAAINSPEGITAGPDGALWFTNTGNNTIGRITTSGTATDFTGTGISSPSDITTGPDGALWFTNYGSNSIGRITTTGTVTNYTGTGISTPGGITAGPDGALWFVNSNNSIGRITTTGTVTNYTGTGISTPGGITTGPDGALWFVNSSPGSSSIGRITTTGTVTNYTDPNIYQPQDIAAGPDQSLWVTNAGRDGIARMAPFGPTVSNVAISGTSTSPQVVVTGSAFGSTTPYPSYAPGCGGSGLDYGSYLTLHDVTGSWDAGLRTVSGASDCVGLIVSSWSDTRIVFGFGSGYGTNGWVLKPGDSYALDVFSTLLSGTVAYPTTTTLTSSQDPSATGTAVTYTASVSGSDDGGTVSFSDGGAAISGCQGLSLNSSGQATCTTAPSVGGAHQIVAAYSGDTGSAGSTSATLTQTVATVIVSSAAAPPLVSASSFTVVFSGPVQGVSTANLTVDETGHSSGIAGSVSCLDASSATVSCAVGPVTTAQFTPKSPLIAGEYYFVLANETAGGIVAAADGTAVPASQTYVRAQTQFSAFQDPVTYKWATVKNAAALGGSYVEERYPGATQTLRAKGSSVGIITWNAPDGGTATVTVTNGNKPPVTQSIDTYAASSGDQTTTVSGLTRGAHTVTLAVNGAKDPMSVGTWVRLDGTVVSGVTSDTPKTTALWPNYPGQYAYTGSKGASVSLMFRGSGVVWTAVVGSNEGKATVKIDGTTVATEDLYAAGFADQTFTFAGLADTFHTLTITATGTKDTSSGGAIVTDAGFTVQ